MKDHPMTPIFRLGLAAAVLGILSSCSPAPLTSLPSTPQMIGEGSFEIPLSEAPSGYVAIRFSDDGRGPQKTSPHFRLYGCGGTYIAKGVILTARHCLEEGFTLLRLQGMSLYFAGPVLPQKKRLTYFNSKFIYHPHADLALLFVDPGFFTSNPPHIVDVFLPPGGKRKPLYRRGRFYGHGGLKNHSKYPITSASGELLIRSYQDLWIYTIIPHIKDPSIVLCSDDSAPWWQRLFPTNSSNLSRTERLTTNSLPCAERSVLLPVVASIKHPNLLFCMGDSGGGLISSEGDIMGVASAVIGTDGICGNIPFFVDLYYYHSWIQEQIKAHSFSP